MIYRMFAALLLVLLVGSCGPRISQPRMLAANERAIDLAAPGLEGVEPTVHAVTESSFGANYQAIEWLGPQARAWARSGSVFSGTGGYTAQSTPRDVLSMIAPDVEAQQVVQQRDDQGGEPRWLMTFRLPVGGLTCVGVKRLHEQLRAPHYMTDILYLRMAAVAYCAKGASPLTMADARKVAEGITFR